MARRGEAVKTFWIVDEQCLPRSFVWRNLGEDIDQHTVIGNWPLMVRMRPIRAPEAAVAGLRNQLAREGHRIRVGWALPRNAIRAADFPTHVPVVDQREQCAECRLIEAERGIDASHMVDP